MRYGGAAVNADRPESPPSFRPLAGPDGPASTRGRAQETGKPEDPSLSRRFWTRLDQIGSDDRYPQADRGLLEDCFLGRDLADRVSRLVLRSGRGTAPVAHRQGELPASYRRAASPNFALIPAPEPFQLGACVSKSRRHKNQALSSWETFEPS